MSRSTRSSTTPKRAGPGATAFDRAAFDRQARVDTLLRQLMFGAAGAALGAFMVLPMLGLDQTQVISAVVAPLVLLALWLTVSQTTAKAAQRLPEIAALIPGQPGEAQRLIDESLRHRPVMRWARLLTYHRLAALRHHQRRFAEAAQVCLAVLDQPLAGPAAGARPHLLLMLAEAQLCCNNLPGAHHALDQLHKTQLSLTDAVQRLALQTRYALMAGAYEHALERGREKIELVELMPAPQSAAVHAMLATAAQKAGRPKLAGWLWERAELLSPPAMWEALRRGGFDVEVVAPDHAAPDPSLE